MSVTTEKPPVVAQKSGSDSRMKLAAKQVINQIRFSDSFDTLRDMYGNNPFIEEHQLKSVQVIGQGAFATVEKAEYLKDPSAPKRIVAVKKLKPHILSAPGELELFNKEISLLKQLNHAYVVEFIGVGTCGQETGDGAPNTTFLVQEYMNGGTLKNVISKELQHPGRQQYTNADALRWCTQIAEALNYLHSSIPMVIHRDLKLENILLSGKTAALQTAKLADFGLSTKVRRRGAVQRAPTALDTKTSGTDQQLESAWKKNAVSRIKTVMRTNSNFALSGQTGSLMYMAPEVYLNKPYNEKADVFSFAIIAYEVFMHYYMLAAVVQKGTRDELERYAARVASGFRPPMEGNRIPPEMRQLIVDCWAQEPHQRPSMEQVVVQLRALENLPGYRDPRASAGGGGGSGGCCVVS